RLQQLEQQAAGVANSTVASISSEEYVQHLERLRAQLKKAWANDERVLALKIAIQAAKLLGETAAPAFYPAMFVLTSELLDLFGKLVYDRIRAKADAAAPGRRGLGAAFASRDVCADAKETRRTACRNWFYKTACIRELLPRFYVEVALLKCYEFLSDGEFPAILGRLGSIARGVGDPLVGVYARCYLAKVGADVAPACKPYAVTMLHDYLFCFKEVRREPFASRLAALGLSDGQYIRLGEPAVEWVLRCIGRGASYEHFETVVAHYRDYCNDATVLAHIVDAFDAASVAKHPLGVVGLAKQAEPSRVTTVALLGRLGRRFAECPPPPHQRLAVLNEVWKVATRCTELGDYVACATAWLDCLLKHYGDREVKVLLGDVIDHVDAAIAEGVLGPNRAGGDGDGAETRQLEDLVQLLIESCSKFGGANVILASDHFLKLLDVFRPHRKVEIAKELLANCGGRTSRAATVSDPVLVHAILEIGRVAHDALDSLSPDGERRHVASLVCGFVDAVDFGRDVERQLGVYVECRAAFHNLDPVLDKVVLEACHLAMCCRKWVAGGQHTERTLGFAKACLAFCHVTIPSIGRSFRRLDLLEHCGHVALLNGCLPHADTFFKAAVTHIPDAPRAEASTYFGVGEGDREPHTEPRLVAFVTKLVGALVAVPGHPDHGPFYLVKGLLNALPKYEHWQKHTGGRAKATLALLPLLAAYAQRRLPYTAPGVEANDVLYGGAPEYLAEL
ncbi:hypothetical protein AURANDRAFT_348, partial [Aureococcus anophagefferens]